eukprot:1835446-Prymnesium_polylepis.1
MRQLLRQMRRHGLGALHRTNGSLVAPVAGFVVGAVAPQQRPRPSSIVFVCRLCRSLQGSRLQHVGLPRTRVELQHVGRHQQDPHWRPRGSCNLRTKSST